MLEEWIETSKDMYHPPIISWAAFEKIAAKSGVHSKNLVAATEFLMTMGVRLFCYSTDLANTDFILIRCCYTSTKLKTQIMSAYRTM